MVETSKFSGGILKKTTKAVDDYGGTQMQKPGSSADLAENSQALNEEQKKFQSLCDGVQNTVALFQTSMTELLALKDELIKHSLPPSLLVKITLVTSQLFRGASDLSVPINELVRLVKLYSAPWEAKSAALKKLHEDYENKQRQLNVALQKLVLVGIQSERMSQERRVLNWERLFSRMMASKAHGYRWKFLIESFKKKMKTGEVYEAGTSTDTDMEKENLQKAKKLDAHRRKTMYRDTAAKRIMRQSVSMQSARESLATPITGVRSKDTIKKEETSEEENLSDFDEHIMDLPDDKDESTPLIQNPQPPGESPKPTHSRPAPTTRFRPKIRFMGASDEEDEEEEAVKAPVKHQMQFSAQKSAAKPKIQFADQRKPVIKTPVKSRGVRFFSVSDDDHDIDDQEDVSGRTQPANKEVEKMEVIREDKQCWTHEPDYDRSLHLRVFRPVCTKAESPCCSIVFNGQTLKTASFPPPPDPAQEDANTGGDKGKPGSGRKTKKLAVPAEKAASPATSEQSAPPDFQEVVFSLPSECGYSPGEKPMDLNELQLKVAIHPTENKPMIAMAAIKYSDIKIADEFEGKWSHTKYSQLIQQFPVISAVSDRDMSFGTTCGHIPIVCFMSKVARPKTLTKAAGTPTFTELIEAEVDERIRAHEAEQEAAKARIPQPIYTEEEMQSIKENHAQEMQVNQEEYEIRLNEIIKGLDAYSVEDQGVKEFIHAATSPLLMHSPSPVPSQHFERSHSPKPPAEPNRSLSKKVRPKASALPAWGKDLPEDFLVRLNMFNENSERYRQELEDKTKRAIQQRYELQMAVHNRLDRTVEEHSPGEEVCLPAVFMPGRSGVVYSPKAHLYFHPTGSCEGRLTQPPSMFKLPHLSQANQVAMLNLLDAREQYLTSGQREYAQTLHPVPQTAPPPPTALDNRITPPYPGRSVTR
ncbi:uncharacterized protein LOC116613501 [Nematostella vectensis]|uniref:uncharacterized protein LOC116613501 n=1 Tax=Nematostella vectensis TaxID=45351 RepID=UPI00207725FE|nr:uncharacterized protein LOC116613501 [Nematostella vectensis]